MYVADALSTLVDKTFSIAHLIGVNEKPETRVRCARTTRDAILNAAREQFSRDSYENVGLRDIAGAAGVDAALVCRYFGSKAELFGEVLTSSGDPGELFQEDRAGFGERVATMLIDEPRNDRKMEGVLIMLRSAASPDAAELVRNSIAKRFHEPFAEWLGGPDAAVRARLIGGIILGMSVSRAMTDGYGLDDAGRARLRERLAVMLQACV